MTLGGSAAPLEPGRELARQWARQELSDPAYSRARPGLLRRAAGWLFDKLTGLDLRPSALAEPHVAVVLLALLVVLLLVVIRVRTGRLRGLGRADREGVLFESSGLRAADHRAAADRAADLGHWDEAVRERFRAVVRDLDERALLDDQPGRTADEAAREASRVLPELAGELAAAAARFDDVAFGQRPAGPADEARLRALDESVRAARPRPVRSEVPA